MRSYRWYGLGMNIRSAKEMGALVRSRRQQCNWTQSELAERADVSALWISQLERGKPTAQFGLVLRTLKELGMDVVVQEPGKDPQVKKGRSGSPAINLDDIVGGDR